MPMLRGAGTRPTGLFVFLMYLCVYMEEEGSTLSGKQGIRGMKDRGRGGCEVALMFYLTLSPLRI